MAKKKKNFLKLKGFKVILVDKPKETEAKKFIGKTLICMCHQTSVVVQSLKGSLFKPTRFEIADNAEHLNPHSIVILDAYRQLEGDETITPEIIQAFDEMDNYVEAKVSKNAEKKVKDIVDQALEGNV
jgi:hypothetical protein